MDSLVYILIASFAFHFVRMLISVQMKFERTICAEWQRSAHVDSIRKLFLATLIGNSLQTVDGRAKPAIRRLVGCRRSYIRKLVRTQFDDDSLVSVVTCVPIFVSA